MANVWNKRWMKNSSKSMTNNLENYRTYSASHIYQRKNEWFWERFACRNMFMSVVEVEDWDKKELLPQHSSQHRHVSHFHNCQMAVPSIINCKIAKLFKKCSCVLAIGAQVFSFEIFICLKRIFCGWNCPREVDYQTALNF